MPQPILYSKLIDFTFEPRAMLQRPALAARIAHISALWNEIEMTIAAYMTALLGAEASTGMSMFLAITNDGAKKAVIDAICARNLDAEHQEKF